MCEATRTALDAGFGHPLVKDGRVITESCLLPADHPDNIRHADGRIAVAVLPEWLGLEGVPKTLAQLTAAKQAEEITAEAYAALLPKPSIP